VPARVHDPVTLVPAMFYSSLQLRAAFAAAFSFFFAFFSLTESLGLLFVFGACCPFAISMTSRLLGALLADPDMLKDSSPVHAVKRSATHDRAPW